MKIIIIFIIVGIIVLSSLTSVIVFGHQSGCHAWHSCPSDTGKYTCGDKGYCSQCPDNQYCKNGKPRSPSDDASSSSGSSSSSTSSGSKSTKSSQSTQQSQCKGTASCLTGIVTKIIDGDTLAVNRYSVRLSLVNTPEKGEAGFKEATSFTTKLCPLGSSVTIDQDNRQPYDSYNRILGKVICSNKILNAELLYNGHANILKQYCSKSEFATESWAKKYGC